MLHGRASSCNRWWFLTNGPHAGPHSALIIKANFDNDGLVFDFITTGYVLCTWNGQIMHWVIKDQPRTTSLRQRPQGKGLADNPLQDRTEPSFLQHLNKGRNGVRCEVRYILNISPNHRCRWFRLCFTQLFFQHVLIMAKHTWYRIQRCVVQRNIENVDQEPSWCRPNPEYN